MAEVLQGAHIDTTFPYARVVSVLNQRADQQDAALVGRWVCAVADGVGGHDSGAEASRTALEVLGAVVDGPRDAEGLRADIATANEAVCALATSRWRSPGTTLVAVAVEPGLETLTIAWCGDSRAWLVEGDAVTLLTTDHSHHLGGLARCLGLHDDEVSADPEVVSMSVGEGLRVLLTTDGVHSQLDERCEGLFPGLLAAGLDQVVRVGCERGTDNATAVLVDVDNLISHARDHDG